ncbi:MAG: response regulator [Lachnospiraceae bacterium]|nr:response regulator [Lachnospiraceae bacterium]
MKNLRVKMTLLIVLVVLISSALILFISYTRARESMSGQLELTYSIEADKYAQELTAWINTNAAVIDSLAADIAVSGIYDDGYDAFHAYLNKSCELLNKNGYIYDIYFTYPNNTMVCASDFMADGSIDYVHDREWYTEAADSRELFYSTPYMDSDTGLPIITISKAVYDNNTLQGVVAEDIFVNTLVDIISEADVAENSYAFLVDRNMGMVVHPNEEYAYDNSPKGIMDVRNAPYGEVISNIVSGSRDTVYITDYDGIERGIVVSKMENTGWYVGVATSKAELMKGVNGLVRGFSLTAVIAVVLGGAIAVILACVLDKMNTQQREHEEEVLKLEKQAADEASKAKSRFLADMSHEIRTPINAILGMNEMVLRETDNRDIRGYSKNIKQSGHSLLQLVNSILDFSKLEDGKMEILPVRYSLGAQISYFMSSISERAYAKSLKLIMDIDPQLPSELYGDDTRINEVVMNLLTNAVKYTEKGSVTLSMRGIDRKSDPEDMILLHVEVRDTGIGIKEEDKERLFESFERLDITRNRSIEGTGLGLCITTSLLKLMGSQLKVESEYGIGSVFSYDLWQKIENDKPIGDYKKAIEKDEDVVTYHEAFHAPDARILVVDDTNMNLLVTESLLKKTGIKLDTALSGAESVQLAEKNKYDIIFMDQRMPGMDGTEAMLKIRDLENKKNEGTPIICLTADVIRGARDRYLSRGFDDYLTKPVDGRALEKMIIAYLPEEKVQIQKTVKGSDESEDENRPAFIIDLSSAGIDTKKGMTYCDNNDEVYKSLLVEYGEDEKKKSAALQNCFENRDWKNYGIYIHSLKSSSKMIGATAMSDIAAELEVAADDCDETTLEYGHYRAMEMYKKLVAVIRDNIDSEESYVQVEDGILEFLPEPSSAQEENENSES